MDISYNDKKLREICNDERSLIKKFGKQIAEKIIMRLNEFASAENLSEIPVSPPPRRHELAGERKGQFAVDLKHPYRLIFIPANDPLPIKSDGGVDLTKISKIEILEVIDYHG